MILLQVDNYNLTLSRYQLPKASLRRYIINDLTPED